MGCIMITGQRQRSWADMNHPDLGMCRRPACGHSLGLAQRPFYCIPLLKGLPQAGRIGV
jgi:hypothetical protein